ncbi:MAG: hypothetical protein BZY88_01605 [SAR202 cluster bacterium Io17-Chloro-G9]|nr:MAG: hypothetical protein BZY88_01605 [SAR202 cluster bacterium Io17-Chloro-G9]
MLEPLETFAVAQFAHCVIPDDQHLRISQDFILELSVALVNHTADDGGPLADGKPEEILLSEPDIWALREQIPITAMVGSAGVGLSIHRKLCLALLRLHPDKAVELHFGDQEEPAKDTVSPQLRQLKNRRVSKRK